MPNYYGRYPIFAIALCIYGNPDTVEGAPEAEVHRQQVGQMIISEKFRFKKMC